MARFNKFATRKAASAAAAGGGAQLIMPQFATSADVDGLSVKTATGTVVQANAAAFWTAMDLSYTPLGWEAVKLISAANTNEQTILDLEGAGVVTSVVAPSIGSAGIATLRVTTDGEEHVFISETLATNQRFLVGGVRLHEGASTAGDAVGYGSAKDYGFLNNTVPRMLMLTPLQVVEEGRIGLPYESALKVTIQSTVNWSATTNNKNAVACHTLFVPEGL